jgi:hypothetical protein
MNWLPPVSMATPTIATANAMLITTYLNGRHMLAFSSIAG